MLKLHPLFLVCFCFPKKRKMKKKMLQLHLQQILLRTIYVLAKTKKLSHKY